MENLSVVFFTNQNGFGLAKIASEYFKKNSESLRIHIVSNKLPQNIETPPERILYHDMDVNYDFSGKHFGESMSKFLNSIDDEFIFFFCDDYFVIDKVKEDELEQLVDYLKCENIDYFGFDEMNPGSTKQLERIYESKCEHPDSQNFVIRNRDHEYLYSVQPCIWKRESFLKILQNGVSLHDLDHTKQFIKDVDGIVALGNKLISHMTYLSQESINKINYFIISYAEIVRHGVFMIPENNPSRHEHEIQVQIVRELCKNEDIVKQDFFKKLLHELKL